MMRLPEDGAKVLEYLYVFTMVGRVAIDPLTATQRSLATLPRLKVLRLLTWPVDCKDRRSQSPWGPIRWREHRAQYLNELDIVADSIARLFEGWRDDSQDRLSVITFGNAEL